MSKRVGARLSIFICLAGYGWIASGQPTVAMPSAPVPSQPAPAAGIAAPAITLDEAINRARTNEPTFVAAIAAQRNAQLDRSIARAALLPSIDYHNQYLYTEGVRCPVSNKICADNAGLSSNASTANPAISSGAPRFIANNAVHEYVSQGTVNEMIGVQQFNALSRATAAQAVANAELEVARRGLVATVANLFYSSSTSERRVAVAERAANEAASVTQSTQQREAAREVAHADVIKAQLDQQQRDRDLMDARLNAEKARLELGVLLFPDPRTPYTLNLPQEPKPVPGRADVEAALAKRNPELQSAIASAHLADLGVTAARAAYLPNLALNYSYGIDASQFASHAPDGSRNLGYSASATLDIPIWDWFTTRDKIRQSQIARNTAQAMLTNTQRRLIANLEEIYAEALAAHDQLDSLNQSVATAAESLRLTRLSYQAGETTILTVVDAEHSLTAAEIAREDGIVRYETALANLQLLTGTL
ncbi:MAG TPA: TolC family protein [Acidobacteriaceae bacterium]|nr:TolC family protein [Acidobacteriaceae bacterium]